MAPELTLSMRWIKNLLYLVNSMFMLTGVMVFFVGWQIHAFYSLYGDFLSTDYVNPATVLMVVGCLVFAISICGIYGAHKESTCMVNVFTMSVTLILIMELSVVIATYCLQDDIKAALKDKIENIIGHYYDNISYAKATDYLQTTLNCCGIRGPSDWNSIGQVPASCCTSRTMVFNHKTVYDFQKCDSYYITGCYQQLELFIHASVMYVMSGAFAVAFIQLAGIMFAITLGHEIRAQKTLRDRRRWEIRESMITGHHNTELLNKEEKFASFPAPTFVPAAENEEKSPAAFA